MDEQKPSPEFESFYAGLSPLVSTKETAWKCWQAAALSQPAAADANEKADPMNYKSMWLAAVSTLAKIDALLGLPEDGCNDPDVTLGALEDYMQGFKDAVESSAFTIEDVRAWIAQGQARALALDPNAAIVVKATP